MMDLDSLFPAGMAHYLAGGVLIGLAVSFIFVSTGIVAGMSSFFSTTLSFVSKLPFFQQARFTETRGWRLVLAAGLVLGALLCALLVPERFVVTSVAPWQLALGGLIAGFGARYSNGCTSGHGICGMASLQWVSLAAVLTFMATAFVTANAVLWLGGK
ncbi:MAG: YeeE/YedE thiosulfate transporter family protein [Moraxellaceae bacterium]|nr:YeeE/YedE thiosulfate transporter family protein [Moraxellaceae bacterium]